MSKPPVDDVDATPVLGEVLDSYGGLDYAWHQAIGEFVDNSIDSFVRFCKDDAGWEVNITYEQKKMLFRIVDNANGMDKTELDRAIKLAKVPLHDDGISKYGLGMKTAASWMGRHWTITTKKRGEPLEWTADVDIEKLKKSGANKLPFTSKFADESLHYTIIEVKKLRRKIGGRSIGKTKSNIAFLYPKQISSGKLSINWGTETLEYKKPEFLTEKEVDGSTTWYDELPEDFSVNGHKIRGAYGILNSKVDIPHAGITLYWRDRVVVGGHRSGWQPGEIFGESQSDLARQRIWVELHMDCLTPNQQKKGFIWNELTKDDLVDALKPYLSEAVSYARNELRRSKGSKPSSGQMQMTDEKTKQTMQSEDLGRAMLESLKQGERAPQEVTDEAAAKMEQNDPAPLRISVNDGEPDVHIIKDPDSHELEPFMRTKTPKARLIKLFLNTNHRFFSEFVGDDVSRYKLYQHMLIALALVQFNANKLPKHPEPEQLWPMLDSILKELKDQD
tara:strand:- start:3560 stop:5071 length:1512 start_codon:yes stop_codon:yes gene_type:complete